MRWLVLVLLLTACGEAQTEVVADLVEDVGTEDLAQDLAQDRSEVRPRYEPPDGMELVFYDVGQGDAALVRFPGGSTMLVDGGNKAAGWSVLLPAFEELRLETLDILVVTHADADHCGGLDDVIYGMNVGVVWENGHTSGTDAWSDFSQAVDEMGVPRVVVERGDSEDVDGCEVVVLAADQGWGDSNGDSVILSVLCEDTVTLLTGDAHAGAQQELATAMGDQLRSDVVKIPHHGSDDHWVDFADWVTPRLAVCSVGANNGYGHPSQAVLDEWEAVGAEILRTDELGTIRVLARAGQLAVLPSD